MIESYRFGSIRIDGRDYHADVKIVGGKVLDGWWRKEGHSVEPGDIEEIFAARPEVLVVGMGDPGRMRVDGELRSALSAASIQLIEEPTARAVRIFNTLAGERKNVAAALHLTC